MKRFAQKLDDSFARREFPIADLVEGWFFRCRKVAIGVYRAEGTDLWGTKVHADGTDPEKLLQDCAESARTITAGTAVKMLFVEYGTTLRLEGDDLVLSTLCGRVGQFGIDIVLNGLERERYKREGDAFVKELAGAIRRDPTAYKSRGRIS